MGFLVVTSFDLQFWQLPDFGNFGDLFSSPTRPFPTCVANKALSPFDPWVTQA
jgi:hypothetical protein